MNLTDIYEKLTLIDDGIGISVVILVLILVISIAILFSVLSIENEPKRYNDLKEKDK